MRIIDLSPEHEELYFHCLEPSAEEIKAGVARKRAWYAAMKDEGLIVKLALDDDGEVAGMIQSLPVEHTHVLGENLHFLLCIWVHGHREDVGNRQGHGLGTALLTALEEEARAQGALGVAAWGMALPFWMKAGWYKRHGYEKVERDGLATLVWKPFGDAARAPAWMHDPVPPAGEAGRVSVTCFDGGWCTLQSANCARARSAAQASGAPFHEVDTANPAAALRWRQTYGVWVDDEQVGSGPPLSEQKVRRKIERHRRRPT